MKSAPATFLRQRYSHTSITPPTFPNLRKWVTIFTNVKVILGFAIMIVSWSIMRSAHHTGILLDPREPNAEIALQVEFELDPALVRKTSHITPGELKARHIERKPPVQFYPTTRNPPCRWPGAPVKSLALSCMRVLGKIVGFTDPYTAPLRFPKSGLWSVEHVEKCKQVDIWIIHSIAFASPNFQDAIKLLPNAPSYVIVDDSGEIGEMDECKCMFNELLRNRTIHGSSDITFVLASQASSLDLPGQRLFNQHWLIPRELAALDAEGHHAENELDHSAVNVTKSRILCLGGYPRPHKVEFMGELDARGLLDRMLWSGGTPDVWTGPRLEYMLKLYNYTKREISDGLRSRARLPHVLDVDRGSKKAGSLTYRSALYDLARVHLVLESNTRIPSLDRQACSRTFRYTEKTLKAMYSGARFLLLADPATLELLRSHGFRTFHPQINETYDTIPTYREKADAIHLEISRILALDEEQFEHLLAQTQATVDHNRQWLLSHNFANMIYRQSLYAYGLTEEPAFYSQSHARAINDMYASLNLKC